MADMSNVVSLTGDALPNNVQQTVIEKLERFLEMAKNGELISFFAVGNCPNGAVNYAWCIGNAGQNTLGGAIFAGVARYQDWTNKEHASEDVSA